MIGVVKTNFVFLNVSYRFFFQWNCARCSENKKSLPVDGVSISLKFKCDVFKNFLCTRKFIELFSWKGKLKQLVNVLLILFV